MKRFRPAIIAISTLAGILTAAAGAAQVTGGAPGVGTTGVAPSNPSAAAGSAPGAVPVPPGNVSPGTGNQPSVGLPPGPTYGAPIGSAPNDSIPPANGVGTNGTSTAGSTGANAPGIGPNNGVSTSPTFSGANQAGVVGGTVSPGSTTAVVPGASLAQPPEQPTTPPGAG